MEHETMRVITIMCSHDEKSQEHTDTTATVLIVLLVGEKELKLLLLFKSGVKEEVRKAEIVPCSTASSSVRSY
jgi:hypothetical protein